MNNNQKAKRREDRFKRQSRWRAVGAFVFHVVILVAFFFAGFTLGERRMKTLHHGSIVLGNDGRAYACGDK